MTEHSIGSWQVIGLTLNVVGIYCVVNGLFFGKPRGGPASYSGRNRDGSRRTMRVGVKDVVQLMTGFVFVTTGYFLQVAHHLSRSMDDRSNALTDPSLVVFGAIVTVSIVTVAALLQFVRLCVGRFWGGWR